MPKIDEATKPANPKMHEWAKRRAIEDLTTGAKISAYTYSCWHVVTTAHGGEFKALFRILLGACRRKAETWRAALEIWYERTFQGKTDADFDRECEQTADTIRGLYEAATPPKVALAKKLFKAQYGGQVEGVGIGDNSLRVYIRDAKASASLPDEFIGVPVVYVVTGEIKAYTEEVKATPVVCPTCKGARHMRNGATGQIVTCWECNAGGTVDKSLRPGKRWA